MPPDTDLAVAIAKMESMSTDVAEIKATMRELASAVSRLAIVEERQSTTNDAISRAFKEITATNQGVATLALRVGSLEQAQPIHKQTSALVQGAVKYILAAVLGAIIAGLWRTAPAPAAATPPAIVGK